ncbi:UvrD-helicase domain-containing protein [Legionella longbeachae]|uniref:DNA 3'-5' helicase n=1 Tax=Legionella longbeachae serogroup 1 (strain NSW150) TaxID=661367 RepID=D3HRC8_LEGLN|nr:UvrD-helicase domain-containing protein [Legionella longbeachae]VEE01962.1 UvrD/REP helicase [Legionella oakridgensis]HBD7396786.1 UvrD-helicase domain-containing protein [Legionella pneumophila]ARB91726.1 ATP-dependent DNA helicase [Legionella longbeachae]ARM35128.1 AAA family ATPase [Legionella longbeachae]EEZ95432.1 putative ATP-dependent DNA helicase [Legionella longbeachae D-4968]
MLVDSTQRSQATDPSLSYIVQAPAGSGKTEILTQRYLRLLSTVKAPEQIVALTFTRKAASEMRERILLALQQAANHQPANSPHQQMTLDFADKALHSDAHYQWNLLQQPGRLRVITIDSLCQSINQAIPLLEKQIAYAQITDKTSSHYLNAGRHCIQYAMATPQYQEAIKTLLLHVDNRQDRLLDLFSELLSQRDQWIGPLFQARNQAKATFEHALKIIEQHELNRFKKSLPQHIAKELTVNARQLALIENNPGSPRYLLRDWHDFEHADQETVKALSKLLLTKDAGFRKSFDHHVGLLASSCSPDEYKRIKNASKELLNELSEYPDFLEALIQVSNLPDPQYDPEQWQVLQALFLLLPLLVGHLHVLFSEKNEVDFTTISQQALSALGDADNPTDLALYLDNTLHHILVDEFQDTSITQFELLTKLVHGWQEGDGKTLFIVGDPMQSIYRFRQAEVGLFFRAKEQGIGSVKLHPLELSCNFRSTQTIVDWVNKHFAHIFPAQIDIESGSVPFHPSVNVIKDKENSTIYAIKFKTREQEAQKLIEAVQHELQAYPQKNIAILVRSRTQLSAIIRLLRQHQIPYQGTDITLLTHLSHLRDVWSLTQALLTPANRLSWLAVLRSPYCGLSLSDIHAIARFNTKKSIYFALLNLNQIQGISEEGIIRARFLIHVMHQALTQRYETQLSSWVIHTLKKLHIENILNESQLNDLEQYWTLLDRYEQDGRLPDMKEFLMELNKLYSQQTNSSRLHVMTIHKSKGLEFDTVILPGLGAQANHGDKPMLRWLNLPTQNHGNLLLMSPIQAAHQEHCALYDYLTQLDEIKSRYETQRLLYVAVTRAKSRLYLMDYSEKSSKSSFRSLLKQQEFIEVDPAYPAEEGTLSFPKLLRLPLNFYLTPKPDVFFNNKTSTTSLTTSIPRLIGIITHRLLHWICNNHPETIAEVPWGLPRYELRKLGFDEKMQLDALQTIQNQITKLFEDPTGSWIIAKHHQELNEYELLVKQKNIPITRIIDRTFEDQGKCWVIDFKTGKEDEASLLKHQQQLNEYGSYLSSRSQLPIYCGIYYLASNHWISWQYGSISIPVVYDETP